MEGSNVIILVEGVKVIQRNIDFGGYREVKVRILRVRIFFISLQIGFKFREGCLLDLLCKGKGIRNIFGMLG